MKKLFNKKGFTLMEMMIVIAIIVILVAIAVPSFNSSLDSANSATDAANLRAAKAVAVAESIEKTGTFYYDLTSGELVGEDKKPAGYGLTGDAAGDIIQVVITGKGQAEATWVAPTAAGDGGETNP